MLSRASSFVTLGALVRVPVGMGLAGVAANVVGTNAVLGAASIWVVLSAAAAMTVPSVRSRLPLTMSDAGPASWAR